MRTLVAAAGLLLAALPATAQELPASIQCTASVTTQLSGTPLVRDLDPSILPLVGYGDEPKERQFKQVARFGDTVVGLFVYRVNEQLAHMRLFENREGGHMLLADTPLGADITELTFRSIGADELITAYCYR